MRKVAYYLVHTFLYYVAWAVGILLASEGKGWESFAAVFVFALIQYVLEYKYADDRRALLGMVLLLTAAGSLVDTIWVISGVADFFANPFAGYLTPPWMVSLWLSFAVFTYATKPFNYFNSYALAVFAFMGYSLVYAIGAKLHVVEFPHGMVPSCALIGAVWAVCLPVFFICWRRLFRV